MRNKRRAWYRENIICNPLTVSGSKCYFSHTLNANIRLLANKEKCLLREVQITVLLCVRMFCVQITVLLCVCMFRVQITVLLCACMFPVPYCEVRYVFHIKQCSGRLYLLFLVGRIMSYLGFLCLFENSGVQHIFFCVFLICLSSSCVYNVSSFYGLSILDCPFDFL